MKKLSTVISTIIVTLFIVTSCDLTEPFSLPAWDTILKVYLSQEEITIKEILEDSDVYSDTSSVYGSLDSIYYFSQKDTTEKQGIDESELGFQPTGDQISESIGTIELSPNSQATPQISFQELFPGLTITIGNVLPPIPPTTLAPPPNNVNFDNDFESVTIQSANMYLVFNNNLIMDINPGMEVSLIDSASGSPIGTFTFSNSILSGQTGTSSTELLENLQLSTTYILSYSVPIVGIDSVHTVTAEVLAEVAICTITGRLL